MYAIVGKLSGKTYSRHRKLERAEAAREKWGDYYFVASHAFKIVVEKKKCRLCGR